MFDESSVYANVGKGHTARLISDLLKDYDRDARPVINVTDIITVTFMISYIQLQELVSISDPFLI